LQVATTVPAQAALDDLAAVTERAEILLGLNHRPSNDVFA
jgi:hypothetical protein